MAAISETNATARELFYERRVIPFGDLTARWNISHYERELIFEERLGAAERYIALQPFRITFSFEGDGTVSARVRPAQPKLEAADVEEFFPNVTELVLDEDSLLLVSGNAYEVASMELNYLNRGIRRATQIMLEPR